MVYIVERRRKDYRYRFLVLVKSEARYDPALGRTVPRQKVLGYIGLSRDHPMLASTVGKRTRRTMEDPVIQEALAIIRQRKRDRRDREDGADAPSRSPRPAVGATADDANLLVY